MWWVAHHGMVERVGAVDVLDFNGWVVCNYLLHYCHDVVFY